MKRLLLLVVLLCGTALWPIHQAPAPSVAFHPESLVGLVNAADGSVHRVVNGIDRGMVDGSFGPEVILRRVGANMLVPRGSVPQEMRIYSTYIDALHYIGRKSSDFGRTWQPLVSAQELVTLTTPIAPPANNSCRLERLTLEPIAGRIYVQLLGTNGEAGSKVYDATTTPTGASLLSQLNRGNFTVNSLIKAVYNRLIADSVCVGTVSGTPQH